MLKGLHQLCCSHVHYFVSVWVSSNPSNIWVFLFPGSTTSLPLSPSVTHKSILKDSSLGYFERNMSNMSSLSNNDLSRPNRRRVRLFLESEQTLIWRIQSSLNFRCDNSRKALFCGAGCDEGLTTFVDCKAFRTGLFNFDLKFFYSDALIFNRKWWLIVLKSHRKETI